MMMPLNDVATQSFLHWSNHGDTPWLAYLIHSCVEIAQCASRWYIYKLTKRKVWVQTHSINIMQ